jgi:hypothetical protein
MTPHDTPEAAHHVRLTYPKAGPCPKCGHSASGVTVGGQEYPHVCCGHPDCMTEPKQ